MFHNKVLQKPFNFIFSFEANLAKGCTKCQQNNAVLKVGAGSSIELIIIKRKKRNQLLLPHICLGLFFRQRLFYCASFFTLLRWICTLSAQSSFHEGHLCSFLEADSRDSHQLNKAKLEASIAFSLETGSQPSLPLTHAIIPGRWKEDPTLLKRKMKTEE